MYIERNLLPKQIYNELISLGFKCYHYSTYSSRNNFTITKKNIRDSISYAARGMNGSIIGNYWCGEIKDYDDLQSYRHGQFITIDDDIPEILRKEIDSIQAKRERHKIEEKLRKTNFTTKDFNRIASLIDAYEKHGENAVEITGVLYSRLKDKALKLIEEYKNLIY